MAFSIFVDALPYNEMKANYSNWFSNIQISELVPNIGYSSSLHWQLYCDKYPDTRGTFVDWVKQDEKDKKIKIVSKLFQPLDNVFGFGFLSKKVLNRVVFRKNAFANIPYRFRPHFTEEGKYLFWSKNEYGKEPIFNGYVVVSQDEGHKTFEDTLNETIEVIDRKEKDIFLVLGFADSLGHKCRRGQEYDRRLKPYMNELKKVISRYSKIYPNEEVLLVSDHGMSTIEQRVDCGLEKEFGKQSKESYIAYSDSAVMCVWTKNTELRDKIRAFLCKKEFGHLLSNEERKYYCVTDTLFGDLIFILKEGNVFADNWFGKSIRKTNEDGAGMHGFWPERNARDQMATITLINGKRKLNELYDYRSAYRVINSVMQGDENEVFSTRE